MPPDSPTPPDSLPKYLYEPLERQDIEKLRNVREYIDQLIEWRARSIENEEFPGTDDPADIDDSGDGWIIKERVKCGDESCRCASGNETDMHGPYEYRYYRAGGTLKKEYVGKA